MEPDDTTLRCRYGIHANDPHHQACEYTIIIADEVMIFLFSLMKVMMQLLLTLMMAASCSQYLCLQMFDFDETSSFHTTKILNDGSYILLNKH